MTKHVPINATDKFKFNYEKPQPNTDFYKGHTAARTMTLTDYDKGCAISGTFITKGQQKAGGT